jgi:hypothetical protein
MCSGDRRLPQLLIAVVVALLLVEGAVTEGSAVALRDAGKKCGRVASKYGRFKVEVLRGGVDCGTARYVIRYVLSHGPGS